MLDENKTKDFQKLLDASSTKIPKKGDIVKGKIINISNKEVNVDINGITTGIIRGRELFAESEDYSSLKLDDEVEATVIDVENENGEMELSFRFAGQQKAWDGLRALLDSGEIIEATITDANKGGLMMKVKHMIGFLPVSQLAPEHYPRVQGGDKGKILEKLKKYAGEKFQVKVIDVDEKEEKVIVSEKVAWEETQKDVIGKYKVEEVVEGKVAAVTDFGVFIKFGENDDLEGLIHISELAWQRIDNPNDIIEVGQTVKAEIISIQGSKIFLSMKKLKEDPWTNVDKKYKAGQLIKGKVLKINPFGFFVELDPEIHGLAHMSELSDKPNVKPTDLAKPGDTLEFRIISVEPKEHRLGLSLKDAGKKAAAKVEKDEKETGNKKLETGGDDGKAEDEKPSSASEVTAGKNDKKEEDEKVKKEKVEKKSASAPASAEATAGKKATADKEEKIKEKKRTEDKDKDDKEIKKDKDNKEKDKKKKDKEQKK